MRTYSERGFAQYDNVETEYGESVHVYQSSSAEGDFVWLSVKGLAFLGSCAKALAGRKHGVAENSFVAAHLSVEQAERVRDALNEWLSDIALKEVRD